MVCIIILSFILLRGNPYHKGFRKRGNFIREEQKRKGEEGMTRERMEKELQKIYSKIKQLQERAKDLEQQKQMAEDAETMKIIKKYKISSEQLQLWNQWKEEEIFELLKQKKREEKADEKQEESEADKND